MEYSNVGRSWNPRAFAYSAKRGKDVENWREFLVIAIVIKSPDSCTRPEII
jgi:hypothetical protein